MLRAKKRSVRSIVGWKTNGFFGHKQSNHRFLTSIHLVEIIQSSNHPNHMKSQTFPSIFGELHDSASQHLQSRADIPSNPSCLAPLWLQPMTLQKHEWFEPWRFEKPNIVIMAKPASLASWGDINYPKANHMCFGSLPNFMSCEFMWVMMSVFLVLRKRSRNR